MPKNKLHPWLRFHVPIIVALVAFAGCSSGSDSSVGGLGIDDGAQQGQKTSALVTSEEGGTLVLKTGAKVEVPAGAVDKDVEIVLERPADKDAVELTKTVKSEDKISSAPYVVTPHGSEFKKEVEVTLPVAPGADKEKVVVAWLEDENDKNWKYLTVPEIAGNLATFSLSHFSVLILLEQERPGLGGESDAGFTKRDGATGSRDAGADRGEDASTGSKDAGSTSTMDASGECVPATTCQQAIARPGVGECGELSNGCGGTLYCENSCASGEYCDYANKDCKPSACGTACAAVTPWAAYCVHEGLGQHCFPGNPAWSCDEQTAQCSNQEGLCVACDGKCIGDKEGCDPDQVRVIGAAGGTLVSPYQGTLTVPAGAVSTDTEFRSVVNPEFGTSGFAPAMPSYNNAGVNCFGPYLQTLAQPVTLELVYSFQFGSTPSSVALFKLDNQSDTTWTLEGKAIITAPATVGQGEPYKVTVQTYSLGCFGFGYSYDF